MKDMEERRQSSLDAVLTTLGEVKQVGLQNAKNIQDLSERVAIQNGRVGKVEQWQSTIRGALIVLIPMVTLIAIPVAMEVFKRWLNSGAPH